MGPILTAEIKKDLNILFWLCDSGLKGSEVLDLMVETVMNTVAMCFRITEPERLRKLVRTEAISLLYGLAVGEIDYPSRSRFGKYLFGRYRRLIMNAAKKGLITAGDLPFSSLLSPHSDKINRREEEELEAIFYNQKKANLPKDPALEKAEEENQNPKKPRASFTQEKTKKTIKKEFQLLRVKSFHPGCLKDQIKPDDGGTQLSFIPGVEPKRKKRRRRKARKRPRPFFPVQGEKSQGPTLSPWG